MFKLNTKKYPTEVISRLLWQQLFNEFRGKNGNLDLMDNLLIDYTNCQDWVLSDDPREVLFGFWVEGNTLWKPITSGKVEKYLWLLQQWDYIYHIVKSPDYITITELQRAEELK